jgi:hypothetical protein
LTSEPGGAGGLLRSGRASKFRQHSHGCTSRTSPGLPAWFRHSGRINCGSVKSREGCSRTAWSR